MANRCKSFIRYVFLQPLLTSSKQNLIIKYLIFCKVKVIFAQKSMIMDTNM